MAHEPLNLDESGEWAGLWWLPDDPDERLPGVLRYGPVGGPVLSLIGAFEDRVTSSPAPGVIAYHGGRRTWDVIHGVAEQREITLLGCAPLTTRTIAARVKSPDKQIVKAYTALIGAQVGGEDDIAFSAVEVSVEDLGRWAASPMLNGFHGIRDGKPDGSGSISVKPSEDKSVVVDATEFRLAHRYTLPFLDQRRGVTVGRMRDTAFMRIVPAHPFSVSGARDAVGLVQDLIAFATHRAAGVIWLRLQVAGTGSVSHGDRPSPRRSVDVLYSPSVLGEHDAKAVDDRRVLFTCASLPFEQVVPRWCEARGRLQAAINMVLGLRYAPARYVEGNLLTAVGAAEVLHRGLGIVERPIPPAEFEAMREAMLTHVPENHRQRFKGAIRNDPTLRDRLYALAARPDDEAIRLLIPDVDRWAERTTRARNDLAHEGRTPKHSVEELFAVVEVTTAVVILNVLHELGVPAERQRELVKEHPQLRTTATMARDYLVVPETDI